MYEQEDCFNDNNNNLGLAHKSPGNNTLQVVLNSAANCSLKPALSSFPHFLSSFSNQDQPTPPSPVSPPPPPPSRAPSTMSTSPNDAHDENADKQSVDELADANHVADDGEAGKRPFHTR